MLDQDAFAPMLFIDLGVKTVKKLSAKYPMKNNV